MTNKNNLTLIATLLAFVLTCAARGQEIIEPELVEPEVILDDAVIVETPPLGFSGFEPSPSSPLPPTSSTPARLGVPIATEAGRVSQETNQVWSPNWLNNLLIGEQLSQQTGVRIRGWANGGVTINDGDYPGNELLGTTGLPDNYVAPLASGNGPSSPVRFNDDEGFQMNQFYVSLSKPLDYNSYHGHWGFQADVLYGTDARYLIVPGLDDEFIDPSENLNYRVAFPELNVQFFVPFVYGTTVKIGHFLTPIGYERPTAPHNFFYSHSYYFAYGQPLTHTGILFSWKLLPNATVDTGLVRGWDDWDDNNNAVSFLGRLAWQRTDRRSFSFSAIVGPEQNEPRVGTEAEEHLQWMYSLVYTRKMWDRWMGVLEHQYGYEQRGSAVVPGDSAEWYGLACYLYYRLNEKVSIGTRTEWFRDDDGARIPGFAFGVPGVADNFFGITIGANYRPEPFIVIRPELRWDWQSNDSMVEVYNGGLSRRQFTASTDLILKF